MRTAEWSEPTAEGTTDRGYAMTGRAIWKGQVHFGGFDLPVKLHTAVKEERIEFHLLHERDHVRLRQQMVCAYENVPVPSDEQVKGFELEDGKYVLVDPADLKRIEPEDSRIIEVHEFVKVGQVDPIFVDRAYYLEPDEDVRKYNALAGALRETGVEGICTWTMRKRSYVGALQSGGKALRLISLRYADELISAKPLGLAEASLSEKELKVGRVLINQLSGTFRPQQFRNEHEKKLKAMIQKKASGQKIVISRPTRLKPTTPDKLLKALEASLKRVA